MIFIDLKPGKTVEEYDIPAFRSEDKSSKYVYLLAGTHGDEVEGVYVLQRLFEWLKENDELKIPLVVVPILNIDGYKSSTRFNSHGVDLNRNYPTSDWEEQDQTGEEASSFGPAPLSEPENKFLTKILDKFPPHLIISFHSGRPVLDITGDCLEFARFVEQHNLYATNDNKSHPPAGSLEKYAMEKFNCPVFIYKTPIILSEKSLKEIWEENQTALKKLFTSDLMNF